MTAPRRAALGEHRVQAAREVLRYARTLARAAEHIRDVSKAYDLRTLSFVEGIKANVRSIEKVAERQLAELDAGDPDLFAGGGS